MEDIIRTPWDQRAFGIDTYEIRRVSEDILSSLDQVNGHFTVKISPLESKALLHQYGFYYCDTLIEPYGSYNRFQFYSEPAISINEEIDLEEIIDMCFDTFHFDRFHRDFHIDSKKADGRYANWLRDIYKNGNVFALRYRQTTAGFFACHDERILLHALHKDFRGKGLAKYFWSAACQYLYSFGYKELVSSVSAANTAIVNVYHHLGFSFRNPVDIYHRINHKHL
ncbi:GNAT family N-acetyltransferase [Scopulibacillus cellulosilyticus]|uniref:GNAT family N-acetyltransferase n=1 Tax=Scopulibacillus cellulosilyticus TaxID=2665665 RepID=A0ABW2PZU9_9BACL